MSVRACPPDPCNLTEWKDLKQKITDMAGKSHQRVARGVGLWNRCKLRWQIYHSIPSSSSSRGRQCYIPPTSSSSPYIFTISTSPFVEYSVTVCSVSLVSQAHHQVESKAIHHYIYIYNTKSNACILSSQCQTSDRTVSRTVALLILPRHDDPMHIFYNIVL